MLKSNSLLFALLLAAALQFQACTGQSTVPNGQTLTPTKTTGGQHLLTGSEVAAITNPYFITTTWAAATTSHAESHRKTFHQRFLNMPDTSCGTTFPTRATAAQLTAACLPPDQPAHFDIWARKDHQEKTARANLALRHLWTLADPSAPIPPNTAASFRQLITADNHPQYATIVAAYTHCNTPQIHVPHIAQAKNPSTMAAAWLKAVDQFNSCVNDAHPKP